MNGSYGGTPPPYGSYGGELSPYGGGLGGGGGEGSYWVATGRGKRLQPARRPMSSVRTRGRSTAATGRVDRGDGRRELPCTIAQTKTPMEAVNARPTHAQAPPAGRTRRKKFTPPRVPTANTALDARNSNGKFQAAPVRGKSDNRPSPPRWSTPSQGSSPGMKASRGRSSARGMRTTPTPRWVVREARRLRPRHVCCFNVHGEREFRPRMSIQFGIKYDEDVLVSCTSSSHSVRCSADFAPAHEMMMMSKQQAQVMGS